MIAFIKEHREVCGVEPICRVLQIAPSTFYAHLAVENDPDKASDRAKRDAELRPEMKRVWEENLEVYGARKLCRAMKRKRFDVARCTVERLLRDIGIKRLSQPRVEAFFNWSEQQLMRIPGQSDLAKAFRYGLSRRDAFSLFLSDGRVAIDNNPAERALRPIGIGRKNWLFAGADTGAETLARAMTIIETAKLNGLDPQAYLADVLDRIHDHKINQLDELLPWNWKALKPEASSQAAKTAVPMTWLRIVSNDSGLPSVTTRATL